MCQADSCQQSGLAARGYAFLTCVELCSKHCRKLTVRDSAGVLSRQLSANCTTI